MNVSGIFKGWSINMAGKDRNGPTVKETIIDTTVTYTIQYAGKFYIIEHVPARVCRETGEQFFAPETVEHIQSLLKGKSHPARVIETPIFEYA